MAEHQEFHIKKTTMTAKKCVLRICLNLHCDYIVNSFLWFLKENLLVHSVYVLLKCSLFICSVAEYASCVYISISLGLVLITLFYHSFE